MENTPESKEAPEYLLHAQKAGLPPEQIAAMGDHAGHSTLKEALEHEGGVLRALFDSITSILSGDAGDNSAGTNT
ncbi:hypothetical protein A2973_00115 [Candidatus Gottesmanbacteria bacterium RIFCSPLOWO2_01_FULL_49_10]|uniref:Uncharacterized protein n=1 Tax=Candidatus Gottesmanbacteria bacterium RIFCSPLOWO2_01_FULL_49_10 TaxID=1798396 RepID=A0A1F6B166_9BACT|nr:MAG: hypothetical protein A2973_00115 [Candidatus Gottesmanbacteria bacterium RIFCSPLOWO2_01_FULL_49_10]